MGNKSCQPMETAHSIGPWDSEVVENTYQITTELPDDELWDFMIDAGRSNATEHQVLPKPATATLGSAPRLSYIEGLPSSCYPSSDPYFAGVQSRHPTIQAPTDLFATFNAPFTLHPGRTSEVSSSSAFNDAFCSHPLEAFSAESAGHESSSDNITPPDRSCNVRLGLKQQLLALSPVAKISNYDTHHQDLLSDFDSFLHSQSKPNTSDAFADSRAGFPISDDLATTHFHSFEDNRHEQKTRTIHMDEYDELVAECSPGLSSILRQEHPLQIHPAGDPTSSGTLSPRDSSLESLSTTSSISVTTVPPIDDSWECDNCGRVLATKGTKNRNRNKRRHRCPGTGPKYPCPVCSKSFNRGDTRLLHLRRWHPEIQREPPRPRKRKNIQGSGGFMSSNVSICQ